MTALANEISRDLPQESSGVLKELIDQLRVVQLRLPEEQRNALDATIKSIEQGLKQLDIAIRQMSLIGTQAPEIKGAQYVDVSEELQGKLKGKTVLLVFWAAWSEPCLKSLGRIERIREEFQDKDFVVLGVTKFYGMVWDESAKTVERQSEVPQELELKALRSIADYHGTKFGIAVVPESSDLFDQYHVAGVPQLVLIDTNGIVKLVRPGLTEIHFKSIEVEIVKLLDQ
jgi:thiol-disulfide isomerase/thioredoxin